MNLLANLLAEIAQGTIPPLPGARCKGRTELFDQTISQPEWDNDGTAVGFARKAAAQLCSSCPVLDQCASWVDGLPRGKRPRGIVAGRFIDADGRRWDRGQKRKSNTPERLSA